MIHAQFPYKQALKSPDLWFSADSNRFSADSHMGLLGKGKLLAKEFCEVINSKTLPIFISGQTRQSNIRQLRYLCNLRGELKIKHLENAIIEDSLLEDKQLDSLGLSWGDVDEHKLNGANPVEGFARLNKLSIINCPVLITISLFPSLQHVEVRNCHPVILRCVAQLQSLSTLVIDKFPELLYIPKALIENNLLLSSFTISSCPKLRSLPANLGELQNLKLLKIGWFQELHSLPHGFENLTSLETLEIIECPNLVSLPEESLEGLNGLQRLRGLQHLSIRGCPELEKRCESGKGEDWQKISHIPYIYVGSATLPQRRDTASSSSSS
ncbi:unnamed protein product [Dovyalis caffra]|uniref:Uncharacterized protein n=1 Tax=Dovyalis caffra TaxID=77055 RepID=A0AAV1SLG3_9ROSI|nr:unnamed protein product [Dovyalis caffra]